MSSRDISDLDEEVYDSDYLSSCCGDYILAETDVYVKDLLRYIT